MVDSMEMVMSDPKNPEVGDLSVDASDVQTVNRLTDALRRLTKLHDGWEKAANNLLRLKPAEIQRAGMNAEDIARLPALLAQKKRLDDLRPPVERLGEILSDTDSVRSHEIAVILGEQAAQARRRADRSATGDEILGPLGDLLDYQYGPAIKAAATRAKNSRDDEDESPEDESSTRK